MRSGSMWWCLGFLVAQLAGCGQPPAGQNGGGSNNNTNNNGNGAPGSGPVSFPSGGDGAILAIEQEDGVTARILGGENQPGLPASVTAISGSTGQEDFNAAFDSQLRTDRLTIGETEIEFDYTSDTTFNFSVNRGEDQIFTGSALNVARAPLDGTRSPAQTGIEGNLDECGLALIEGLAVIAEQQLSGDAGALPDPDFVSCVQELPEVRDLGVMFCVSSLVLVPVIINALAECTLFEDPFVCFDRATPSLEAVLFINDILFVVLADVTIQLRLDDDLCPSF